MRERLRQFVIPGYVLLCIVLGGSAQGIWRNMVLQLVAVGLIAWAALMPRDPALNRPSPAMTIMFVAVVSLFVLQLVPLPPDLWTNLPGRAFIEAGYANLGYSLPWLPISLTPHETIAASLSLLPALALLLAVTRLGGYGEEWIVTAILCGAFLHILLGTLQTVAGGWPNAWWYVYDVTNPGAVGFFANRNHMGTLLLVSVPFATLLVARSASRAGAKDSAALILGFSALVLILFGLALNQSLAAVILAFPVIAASAMLLPKEWRARRWVLIIAALLGMFTVLAVTNSPVRAELQGFDTTSVETRSEIWGNTLKAITDTFPMGTGIGSFEQVYAVYEDDRQVNSTYVNHAHNDYLEIILEGGGIGLALGLAFIAWWGLKVAKIWNSALSSNFVKAATIASGAILAHSIVDYPLRTTAIAAIFAASVGIISRSAKSLRIEEKSSTAAPVHLVIQ